LLVHAHPDDETIGTGATMAKYAAAGTHVALVTCTLGEEGEIIVPALAHLAADRSGGLGEHRIGELAAATAALGVADHRWLGGAGRWRDSGMMGEASNDRPDCFWQADLDDAVGELVAVVREVRPQVMVGYDANGGYGHPDHIQAHRVAVGAFAAAGDPVRYPWTGEPWSPSRYFEPVVPRSVLRGTREALRAMGAAAPFEPMAPADLASGVDDEQVTTRIDAQAFLPAKLAALRAYPTQVTVQGEFFALSNHIGQRASGVEHYRLALSVGGRSDRVQTDLFGGLV
jgi:N-acetyl-1-D-myo-inositol-2-amino-2-deoxy-alpha-D-glucopyranoside deacetylase